MPVKLSVAMRSMIVAPGSCNIEESVISLHYWVGKVARICSNKACDASRSLDCITDVARGGVNVRAFIINLDPVIGLYLGLREGSISDGEVSLESRLFWGWMDRVVCFVGGGGEDHGWGGRTKIFC